eukprot:gene2398-2433_t
MVAVKAQDAAEERVLDGLVGPAASPATRSSFRKKLRDGDLDDKEIEIELTQSGGGGMPMFELPNMPGASIGAINLSDMFGKGFGGKKQTRRLTVKEAYAPLIAEESEKLIDSDATAAEAIREVENNGIVFLDEIDKICTREGRGGGDVSREGVQRDLLPLIEGTTVATKHGAVKTDHILFIASGAFHVSKPSDLLPELQGRLPIRVELSSLTEEDFRRILTDTEASLVKQYVALLETEGVHLEFEASAIDALAKVAVQVNDSVENIGARRLQTVMERVLDEVSFTASDRNGETIVIDGDFVEKHVGDLARNTDLSRLSTNFETSCFAGTLKAAIWLAIGVSIAGLLQSIWCFIGLKQAGLSFGWQMPQFLPQMRQLCLFMLPGMFAGGITQINAFVLALEFAVFLTLPAAVALCIAAVPIIGTLFERGAFGPESTIATASALKFYALGLPAFIIAKALQPAFFAASQMRAPMLIALFGGLIDILFAYFSFASFSQSGIALAAALAGWFNAIALGLLLWKTGRLQLSSAELARLLRQLVCAATMGLAVWGLTVALAPFWQASQTLGIKLVALSGLVFGGGLVFFAMAWALGCLNWRQWQNAF